MAELAVAGRVVGLISLSIQSCQGLTSYYSAWKSYDAQISQTYRNVDELKITGENLERELQRITQHQEPAVQQVVRLIASNQDGIKSLRDALDRCHSTQLPQNLAARAQVYRARALYPFKKQTLHTLKDTVHSIQGNLSSALQILQLHLSAGHEQRLAYLVRTASGTETAVHNNQIAIQQLSSPLQAISQAFPLIQQQTENTGITVRAVHDEAHESRRDAREFREQVLQELRNLASRVDSSSSGLETNITLALNSHSAGMNQLKHDLQFAHSQHAGEVVEKLEAVDQSIQGLQLGIISKPGLMQSVCEENHRLENLSASANARNDGWRPPEDGRIKRHQSCNCKLKRHKKDPETLSKSSHFELTSIAKWKFIFETESMSHNRTCPLFANSASTTMARFRIASCGALLAGAIEASISITRGAGGLSISPVLRCAHVVASDNPAFRLISNILCYEICSDRRPVSRTKLEAVLDIGIREIERLFRAGKASPYDVDLKGNTLLHVACNKLLRFFDRLHHESAVLFLKKLGELCVPLNWTNDDNSTFMNEFVLTTPGRMDPHIVVPSTTRLLDTGAEFAKFSTEKLPVEVGPSSLYQMTMYAGSVVYLDALEDNELSVAIRHQSERELVEALHKWPHLINLGNELAQTPLHLAVGWPYGVRSLLRHGACVDSIDLVGGTPLYYAIQLGHFETISLLMKAHCSLEVEAGRTWYARNILESASARFGWVVWGVSQETRMDILDIIIALLAERRLDLQSQLVTLPKTVKIKTSALRDDRILDEYAEYAECAEKNALRGYDHLPLRASSLLSGCGTVYHIENLRVDVAEKLWQHGFRDIDVHDEDGLTPLMSHRHDLGGVNHIITEIEVCFWLIQKGAKLHRPQHGPLDYDPDSTLDAMELPRKTRALHYVAAAIGDQVRFRVMTESNDSVKQLPQKLLSQLSKDARFLPATIFSDASCDDCVCACSTQGCLASTMMLKILATRRIRKTAREWFALATEYLIDLVGPHNSCWDWLDKEVIRFGTVHELELRHTCCRWTNWERLTKLESEEVEEIREEDHDKIEFLESLLQEFEENRGAEDLMTFLEGYWATRMDKVLEEQGGRVDEEGLRQIGVVLHSDETRESDSDEEGDSDEWSLICLRHRDNIVLSQES